MRQCLAQIEWLSLLQGMTVEESWECFSSELKLLMNNFIPKTNNKRKFRNPYITSEVIRIRKKKLAFWKQYADSQI